MFIRRERALWYVPTFYLVLLGLGIAVMTAFALAGLLVMAAIVVVLLALTRRVRLVGDRVEIWSPMARTVVRPNPRLHGQVTTNGVGFRVALVTDTVDTLGWTMTHRGADRIVEQLLAVLRHVPRATVRR